MTDKEAYENLYGELVKIVTKYNDGGFYKSWVKGYCVEKK
jgi:hypothetical protein